MAHATETSVKWYCNTMQGAGTGLLPAILQKCLVDGFNQLTVDSVAVLDQVATVTRASGHGYLANQIITVAGATPSGLNGEKRVLSVTLTTFTFDATGISDQTATGTITTKTSPAGWQMPFSSTNRIALRSPNPLSKRSYYRFDSTAGNSRSRPVSAYVTMTGIDTGSLQWCADSYMGDTDTQWVIVADDRTVYLMNYWDAACTIFHGFGDFIPLFPNDPAPEFMSGHTSGTQSTGLWGTPSTGDFPADPKMFVRSDLSGNLGRYAYVMTLGNTRITGALDPDNQVNVGTPVFPSTLDNGAVMTDAILRDNHFNYGWMTRGKMRGYKYSLQNAPVTWTVPPQLITGVSGLDGRVIAMVGGAKRYSNANRYYRTPIDITGPWG